MKSSCPFFCICLIITLSACSDRIGSCLDFKTGAFEFQNEEVSTKYRIERDLEKQVETNINTKHTSSFNIKWITDCKYELELVETNDPNYEILNGRIIEVNIFDPGKDQYEFSSKIKGTVEEYRAILKRVQ